MKTFLMLGRIAWVLGTLLSFALAFVQANRVGGEFGILSGVVAMLVGFPLAAFPLALTFFDLPELPIGHFGIWSGWLFISALGFIQWFAVPRLLEWLIWRWRNRGSTLPPWTTRE